MKKILTLLLLGSAISNNLQAQYQLKNAGFEEWEEVSYTTSGLFGKTYKGEEPLNWNSFLTGEGQWKSTAGRNQLEKVSETRPGSTGQYSAKLFARDLKIAIAQGNLTTGCINMGSMSADDATGNYNFTKTDDENLNQKFSGLPDAMHVWVKFYSTNTSYHGKINTILHTEGYYQDPLANDITAKLVAKAEKTDVTTSNEWQELTIPFTYENGVSERPAYALVSFATNTEPGKGAEGDYMLVDDLEYLYYSELNSLKYDDKEYYNEGINTYSIDAVYDKSKLTCTSNGKGATIEPSYNEDEALLTITVKGNDVSVNPENVHTYTVQFAKPQPEITEYENDLLVALNGQGLPTQKAKIQLIKELDGTTSLALNNFILGSGEEAMPVGNIKLTNLEIKDNKIQTTQTINITAGDLPGSAESDWLGPILGEVPVSLNATLINDQTIEAVIDIPLAPGSMEVKVTFAETQTYTDGEALSLTTGLTNVVYNRIFPAGWSTVCLPFATTATAFGTDVKAQAFTSADANGLNFTEVTDLEANKPYLIYFPSETTTPLYFGAEVSSTTPEAVTYGDFTFCGSYAASMSMAGNYGVADQGDVQKLMLGGAGSTLSATRAYFTKDGAQPAEINLNLWGDATGIDAVTNDAETFDVYNLQGVMVRQNVNTLNGLQKGIYIVNGKKVSVK